VDGSKNPELFLPIELLGDLVLQVYFQEPEGGELARQATLARWKDFGISSDPEPIVRAATEPMLRLLLADRDSALRGEPQDRTSPHYCRATHAALANLRRHLSPDDMDGLLHLLYSTLAGARRALLLGDPEVAAQVLRDRAEGCGQ